MQDAKTAKNSPSAQHRTTLSSYIFATATKACTDNRTNLLSSNISSTCPHNMMNFGPLTAKTGWRVWGTPANFNGFRVFASLLQRRRSTEVNQTLHDVCPSPGLVHYIYILGGFCPWRNFATCKIHFASKSSFYMAALLHGTPAAGVSQTLQGGTRNGITELSHTAPPIFGWSAIMLSIGPHF